GRSRAFVNGALATAGTLKELSSRLVELHGQHEHQTLLDPATHVPLVDAYGGLEARVADTEAAVAAMREVENDLARARTAARDRQSREELITLQLGELDRAAPKAAEDEELTAVRQVLTSAERVERLCEESYASLYERDDAVLTALGGVWRRVS